MYCFNIISARGFCFAVRNGCRYYTGVCMLYCCIDWNCDVPRELLSDAAV